MEYLHLHFMTFNYLLQCTFFIFKISQVFTVNRLNHGKNLDLSELLGCKLWYVNIYLYIFNIFDKIVLTCRKIHNCPVHVVEMFCFFAVESRDTFQPLYYFYSEQTRTNKLKNSYFWLIGNDRKGQTGLIFSRLLGNNVKVIVSRD
jgi:hypothetical protein